MENHDTPAYRLLFPPIRLLVSTSKCTVVENGIVLFIDVEYFSHLRALSGDQHVVLV